MKALFFVLLFILSPCFLKAQENTVRLTTTQAQRAEMLSSELRCLVCQNENILDSSSPLAAQLRYIIQQQVSAGASNQQIKHYMVARYGVFILLKPPFSSVTFLLYGSPFFAFVLGFWLFYRNHRQLGKRVMKLTEAEITRLNELLK